MSAEQGYARALPLCWLAALADKLRPVFHKPCTEWQAAVVFLNWVRQRQDRVGRTAPAQTVLVMAGGYKDNWDLWHAYQTALWGNHHFRPYWPPTRAD